MASGDENRSSERRAYAGPRLERWEKLKTEQTQVRDEVELFRMLADSEGAGFSIERVLGRFLSRAMRLLHTDAGTLFSVVPGTSELVFHVVRGKGRQRLRDLRLPVGQGIAGWVAEHGVAQLVRDVRHDRRWWKQVRRFVDYPAKDILAVPIKGRAGALVGVIELLCPDDHVGFTDEDLNRLIRLAGAVGILMEDARLWEETRRQNRQLRLLNEVSRLVNSSLNPRQVHTRAIRAATQLLDCEAASLLLRDIKSGELYFEVAHGRRAGELELVRLKPGEGIAGWVVANDQPLNIQDCGSDPRWSPRVDSRTRFKTRNMICVPVRTKGGEVLGALQAINKNSALFDAADVGMLQTLADQVAVALQNAHLFEELNRTLVETSEALAESIEVRDAYTGGHTRRVVAYSLAIANQLNLPPEKHKDLRLAAILHDIGKIGVEDRVLRKPGRLDQEEFVQMRRHPALGCEIINHIGYLANALDGIRSHHERHDGQGYPDGLKCHDIPLLARIIAVADTYDAMTSDRPYRRGLDPRIAVQEIRYCSGKQFDPDVVTAFLKAFRQGDITGRVERLPPQPRRSPMGPRG